MSPNTTTKSPESEANWQKFQKEMEIRVAARIAAAKKERQLLEGMKGMGIAATAEGKARPSFLTGKMNKSYGRNNRVGKTRYVPKPYMPKPLSPMLSQPPRRPKRNTNGIILEDVLEEEHLWEASGHKKNIDESLALRLEEKKLLMETWKSRAISLGFGHGGAEASPIDNKRKFDEMIGKEYTRPIEPRAVKKMRTGFNICKRLTGFNWTYVADFEVERLSARLGNIIVSSIEQGGNSQKCISQSGGSNKGEGAKIYVPLLSLPEKDSFKNEVDKIDLDAEHLSMGEFHFKSATQQLAQESSGIRATTAPKFLPCNKLTSSCE